MTTTATFHEGETFYLDMGSALAPTAVFAASVFGTIAQVTEKAIKIQLDNGNIWLPISALSAKGSGDNVKYRLKAWFRPNSYQRATLERNTHVSGVSL